MKLHLRDTLHEVQLLNIGTGFFWFSLVGEKTTRNNFKILYPQGCY